MNRTMRTRDVRASIVAACMALAWMVPSGWAAPQPVESFQKDDRGVTFQLGAAVMRLDVYDDRTIRVRTGPGKVLPETREFVVNRELAPTAFELKEEPGRISIRTGRTVVDVNRATGALTYRDAGGRVLLEEPPEGGKSLREVGTLRLGEAPLFRVEQRFLSPEGERLYGLSQSQDGVWNWRGIPIELRQHNTQAAIPVMVSSRGYGLLWNNASLTEFNPVDEEIPLNASEEGGAQGPTATEQLGQGGAGQERRRPRAVRTGTFMTREAGEYVFLAKDGDRRNEIGIVIDGKPLIHLRNMWVPYTTTGKLSLPANTRVTVQLQGGGRNAKLFARSMGNTTTFRSQLGGGMDYLFFNGPTMDEVIAAYRKTTGTAAMWPRWAFGFWQCRERYSSQKQIVEVAQEFRKRQIPVDLIVQDWQYWGPHGWGAYEWDKAHYPDPAAMIKSLHELNFKYMISVWSNPQGKVGADLKAKSLNVQGTDWVDVFNPAGREARWRFIDDAFYSIGTDAWWQDATEPGDDGNGLVGRATFFGPGDVYRNAYPIFANQTVYEGQRKVSADKRVVILTRSAFPGQQRYGTALWSGDIAGDWVTLRRQIPAGLHVSLTGLPYWTTDAGGFFRPRDQYQSEDYAELLTRWFQYSTFCPIQRIHGYQSETEFWKFPKAEQALIAYTRLRYRMLPYLYSLAWRVTHDHDTMMRPLPMDFAEDEAVLDIDDQYMFGPALLVSPVTQPKATTRSVYLPKGSSWVNFWTGEVTRGGQRIEVAAPKEVIPLFVRAGSILPLGPDVQFASEKSADPLEIRVYRGANGSFTLYEDEGDGYRFETGAASSIPVEWNETNGTLTFGERRGEFPGMLRQRTFRVVWVRPGRGGGPDLSAEADVEVRYEGAPVTVKPPPGM